MKAEIRLARADDAPQLASIYRPSVEASVTSFEVVAPDAEEMERRRITLGDATPWLVFEVIDGEGRAGGVAGYAYASPHRDRAAYQWSVDAAVYVRGDWHRAGVGRALYASLFAILRLQGFRAVHAGISLPNAGSVGLHEALGFRRVGVYEKVGYKFGAWQDVGWWQLELAERVAGAPPAAPRSLSEVQRDPGWSAALAAGRIG